MTDLALQQFKKLQYEMNDREISISELYEISCRLATDVERLMGERNDAQALLSGDALYQRTESYKTQVETLQKVLEDARPLIRLLGTFRPTSHWREIIEKIDATLAILSAKAKEKQKT